MVVAVVEERMVLGAVGEETAEDAERDAEEDISGVMVLCKYSP